MTFCASFPPYPAQSKIVDLDRESFRGGPNSQFLIAWGIKDEPGKFSPADVAYGALGTSISLSVGYGAMRGAEHLMHNWGVNGLDSNTYFHLYDSVGKVSNGLLRGVLKSLAVVYVVLLVPIIEEWFFRDLMYKWQESNSPGEKTSARIYRVISNGLIFGAFHFSLLLGWSNILVVVVSTIAGIVFALLRELRGDRWASTIAHSLNNSFVLFFNFSRI